MLIRLAQPSDAAGILAIYAPYIRNTSLTFELGVPAEKEFVERIQSYLAHWPWLVCEIDGQIAGYAYGSKYRERLGYQWCVECSVYVHDAFLRQGVGKALYTPLFQLLKEQGYRNVYAVINLPNERSVRFHEECGFVWFATYKKVGYKLGQWKDVGWWQLVINDYTDEPASPIPFSLLDKKRIETILSNM